jgi:hypothetical protein
MFVAEDGAFAGAGAQRHINGTVDVRKMMARLRLTQEAMDDSTSSEAAWKSAKKDEMTRIIDDIAKREEFALSTDGKGVFCLLGRRSGPTTARRRRSTRPATSRARASATGSFRRACIWRRSTRLTGRFARASSKVSDVNEDGTDYTPDAAVNAAWADNDYLVQAANSSVTDTLDTAYEKAYWGLPALIDDGTNRATVLRDQPLAGAVVQVVRRRFGRRARDGRHAAHGGRRLPEARRRDRPAPDAPERCVASSSS